MTDVTQLFLRFYVLPTAQEEIDTNAHSRDYWHSDDDNVKSDGRDEDGLYFNNLDGLCAHELISDTLEDALIEISSNNLGYGSIVNNDYAIFVESIADCSLLETAF